MTNFNALALGTNPPLPLVGLQLITFAKKNNGSKEGRREFYNNE